MIKMVNSIKEAWEFIENAPKEDKRKFFKEEFLRKVLCLKLKSLHWKCYFLQVGNMTFDKFYLLTLVQYRVINCEINL